MYYIYESLLKDRSTMICVCSFLLQIEYQMSHVTSEVRTFWLAVTTQRIDLGLNLKNI